MDNPRGVVVGLLAVIALVALFLWVRGSPEHGRGELPAPQQSNTVI